MATELKAVAVEATIFLFGSPFKATCDDRVAFGIVTVPLAGRLSACACRRDEGTGEAKSAVARRKKHRFRGTAA